MYTVTLISPYGRPMAIFHVDDRTAAHDVYERRRDQMDANFAAADTDAERRRLSAAYAAIALHRRGQNAAVRFDRF